MDRRLLLAILAIGLPAMACVPSALREFAGAAVAVVRPQPLPQDRAAVFHSLVPGQPIGALGAPDVPWHFSAEEPATVAVSAGGLQIVGGPGRRAWAAPLLPLTPLNEQIDGQIEQLSWDATIAIAPERRFFIVAELRFLGEPGTMLIQATPFDLQMTQDAARSGGGSSQSVSRLVGDGRLHFWRLRLDEAETTLLLDGTQVWAMPGRRALSRVAFGETRSDALHGGSMMLRDVVYVRRPA